MNLSTISSGKITPEERGKNLTFIRLLYTLFSIELLIALIWTSFAYSYYEPFGRGIETHWWWAIFSGSICLILIILTMFVNSL